MSQIDYNVNLLIRMFRMLFVKVFDRFSPNFWFVTNLELPGIYCLLDSGEEQNVRKKPRMFEKIEQSSYVLKYVFICGACAVCTLEQHIKLVNHLLFRSS